MKYLIMTEGTCEKALFDVLLEKNILNYTLADLVYEEIYHARQIDGALLEKINQLPIREQVTIIRVGDKLSDELEIPDEITEKICEVKKVLIKPEFEILYILYLGKYEEYLKIKTSMKASEYLKSIDRKYNKSSRKNYDFFTSLEKNSILNLFKQYNIKRKGTHEKNEMTLLDLCKED